MGSFRLVFIVTLILHIIHIEAALSDKRLCANKDCTVPISLAKTLLGYGRSQEGMLSFRPNDVITIYSKSAGSNMDLWGAEHKGKRGYVPVTHLKETKVFVKNPTFLVGTDVASNQVPSSSVISPIEVQPNKVEFETVVVEGTTLYKADNIDSVASDEVPPIINEDEQIQFPKEEIESNNNVVDQVSIKSPELVSENIINKLKEEQNNVPEEAINLVLDVPSVEDWKVGYDVSKTDLPSNIVEEGTVEDDVSETELQSNNVKESVAADIISTEKETNEEVNSVFGFANPLNIPYLFEEVPETQEITNSEGTQSELENEGLNNAESSPEIGDESHGSFNVNNNSENELNSDTSHTLIEHHVSDISHKDTIKIESNNFDIENNTNQSHRNLLNKETIQQLDHQEVPPTADASIQNVNNLVYKELSDESIQLNDSQSDVEISDKSQAVSTNEQIKEVPINTNQFLYNNNYQYMNRPKQEMPNPTQAPIVEDVPTETILNIVNDYSGENTKNQYGNIHQEENPKPIVPPVPENVQHLNTVNGYSEKSSYEHRVQQDIPQPTQAPIPGEVPASNNEDIKSESFVKYSYEDRHEEGVLQPTETPVLVPTSENVMTKDIDYKNTNSQPAEEIGIEEGHTIQNDTDIYNYSKPHLQHEPELNTDKVVASEELHDAPEKYVESTTEPADLYDIPAKYEEITNNNQEHVETENYVPENKQNHDGIEPMVPLDPTLQDQNNAETQDNNELVQDINNSKNDDEIQEAPSMFSGIFSFFGGDKTDAGLSEDTEFVETNDDILLSTNLKPTDSCHADSTNMYCTAPNPTEEIKNTTNGFSDYLPIQLEDLFLFLSIAAVTIIIFLWGFMVIDKMRKEGPLIAKINELEKALLVSTKENEILSDKTTHIASIASDKIKSSNNVIVDALKAELEDVQRTRTALEDQVQSLEKELENSTEVGLELNRMLSEVLNSSNGSETLMANVEQLQTQLVEQQATINSVNEKLNEKDTENYELQIELEINIKKVTDLQAELDKMVLNLLKLEEEKEQVQNKFELEVQNNKTMLEQNRVSLKMERAEFENDIKELKKKLSEMQRNVQIKTNEYNLLKDTISSKEDINGYLDVNLIKAEKQQLEHDNMLLNKRLEESETIIRNIGSRLDTMKQEAQYQQERYEVADKEKLEYSTKLEVLSLYFKQREAELQKELNKHQTIWLEKEGEATSTTERLKFMQEEIQNFKTQNASLKQEIISQEVELKSQISVLEKKAHENWVAARQAERKFEDSRQEAAQLRNRLTLRERSLIEDKPQNRLQSPLESNGDHLPSPMHMHEPAGSPPLLYGTRDHLTTSPPLSSLPPFLPPPPGVPFMPPPMTGMPPFMPPPPSIYPGDHRPPPLGRMSSPPINSRYSPDSRAYSPYSRNTPSPTDDEYYDHRDYNPYNNRDHRDRRDYGRPPPSKHNMRNNKDGASSGSANSNESLENVNRHNSKV